MKTLTRITALLMTASVFFMACQKEASFEKGNSTASVGSLATDASGNCLGAVISGTYYKDTALKASNYVDVTVQVDTAGSYTISSDTVNGYYFKASGTFSATGTQTVRLIGGGKPLAAGSNIFTVTYNGTICEFTVTVTAPAGGSSAFTIDCTGATPTGTYMVNTPLSASANTIILNVSVTAIGSWSVTTAPAVNGMTFSGTGNFTNTGAQTITLTGGGTPVAAATNTLTVSGGTGTCTFQVTVTAAAPPDYFPRTNNSNWSYELDDIPADSFLIYSQGTVTKNSNLYNIFWYNDGFFPVDTFGYYRRNAGDYFEFGDISYGVLDDGYYGEFIFLKDNQPVSTTWNSAQFTGDFTDPTSGMTTPITLRWQMTVLQQNVALPVTSSTGTVNYTNVIEIKQDLQLLNGTTWVSLGFFRNNYARDKGLVKQDFYDQNGALNTKANVRRLVIY
jgi:hypothetical protein